MIAKYAVIAGASRGLGQRLASRYWKAGYNLGLVGRSVESLGQTLSALAPASRKTWVEKHNIPVMEAPEGRRDEFVEPYFRDAEPDRVVVVLKAREPARILTAIGDKASNRWHLQFAERWVVQYNFYLNDRRWGRMFVRVCPYLPFSARVCLNQHHWLANRMREQGIDFQQG
jgi:hypothetical protein